MRWNGSKSQVRLSSSMRRAPQLSRLPKKTTASTRSGRVEAARIVVVALAAAAVWLHVWEPYGRVSLIGVAGVLIGGWPIFKEAAENARGATDDHGIVHEHRDRRGGRRSPSSSRPSSLPSFVLAAEVLEGMTVSRGRRAIRDLLDFLPRSVTVRRV